MSKEKLVKAVIENQQEMNQLTVDKVQELAPAPEIDAKQAAEQAKQLIREKAKSEGALFLEPRRKLPGVGKLDPKQEKMRNYDWEYVCGLMQPEVTGNGRPNLENYEFWFAKWPGDPDCLWSIPVNRKVYVPRMIAQHLSGEKETFTGMEAMKFHTFDYIEKPAGTTRPDEFQETFTPVSTQYRGRFVAAGGF